MKNTESVNSTATKPFEIPPELFELERKAMAYHEAGHFIAARHFKVPATAKCWPNPETPTLDNSSYRGTTEMYFDPPVSAFREAAICWAGRLAEELVDRPLSEFKDQLRDILYQIQFDFDMDCNMSETDKQGIRKHPWQKRTLKTAADILIRRYSELQLAAEELIENGRVQGGWNRRVRNQAAAGV